MKILAHVSRGKAAGAVLTPHLYTDGGYVVSPTRFKRDQVRASSLEQVEQCIKQGLSVRMSGPGAPAHRLIAPASIQIED